MSRLRLLTANDQPAWQEGLDAVGQGDVFHCLGYASAFGAKDGLEPQAVWYSSEYGEVFYPFLRRGLTGFKFLEASHRGSILENEYTDIVSPYGYSGPVASNDTEPLWSDFNQAFHLFCLDSRIVTEFARMNPFLWQGNYMSDSDGILVGSQIYVVDLKGTEADILSQMRKGHRYSVRKAEKIGVRIYQARNSAALHRFYELYNLTMEQNKASEWYFFSFQFFEKLWQELGNQMELWNGDFEGRTIASNLIVHNGEWAHYFLSGIDPSYAHLSANHLLLYRIMLDLQRRGQIYFNLGGTYNQDDGLTLFKRGFTHQGRTFYNYRKVHIVEVYNELCYLRFGNQATPAASGYFPAYRV